MTNRDLPTMRDSDRRQQRESNRYTSGKVVRADGQTAVLDVGAVLPDGTAVNLEAPLAAGVTLAVGQTVEIEYLGMTPMGVRTDEQSVNGPEAGTEAQKRTKRE